MTRRDFVFVARKCVCVGGEGVGHIQQSLETTPGSVLKGSHLVVLGEPYWNRLCAWRLPSLLYYL